MVPFFFDLTYQPSTGIRKELDKRSYPLWLCTEDVKCVVQMPDTRKRVTEFHLKSG